jgi:DNA polymerase
MPRGFFYGSKIVGSVQPTSGVPKCGACGLLRTCTTPKMAVSGRGERKILIVGDAPGKPEDEAGKQFIGPDGNELKATLAEIGVSLRRDCWLTNALICRPPKGVEIDNKKLGYCRPNLTKTIRELEPTIIIPLGERALRSVLSGIWRDDIGPMSRWAGFRIPCRNPNAWICPTFHPRDIYRMRGRDGERDDASLAVTKLWWVRHLAAAVRFEKQPWKEIPREKDKIERIHDPNEAARVIRSCMMLADSPAAFDYECTTLKPYHEKSRIRSCSICWEGVKTIAYHWVGEAIEATREFLLSPAPKVASNAKFEEVWTIEEFGHGARNWKHDTMQAAHVQDNRKGVTSIKFQAFVRRGFGVYDHHIKRYLSDDNESGINQIDSEIDPDDLLLYNGLDSKLEWDVAVEQRRELGLPPL